MAIPKGGWLHPEIQSHFTHQVLLRQADEDQLTNLCREPLHQEVLCKYQEFLQRDIASHDVYGVFEQQQLKQESKIYGVPVVRDMPINCYHIPHAQDPGQAKNLLSSLGGEVGEQGNTVEYIGMPIPVPFDRDIGMKKNVHLQASHTTQSKTKMVGSVSKVKPAEAHVEISHHKKLNAMLEKRKQLYSSYTKVDPEIRRKVQADIEFRSRPLPRENLWHPNKFVIEQIRPSTSFDKTKISSKRAKISLSTERFPRFTDVSGDGTSRNAALLAQMVELMDQALTKPDEPVPPQKPAPSVTTEDTIQIEKPREQPKPEQKKPTQAAPQPKKPVQEAPKPKPKPALPPARPPASFVAIAKPPRTVKEVSRTPKTVRVVERVYELDRDSFEVSELVNHIPSRVSSLSEPLVKIARKVNHSEDLALFDRELYTPLDCELVDEHIAELEKRNIYTRTLRDVQIPVVYNHAVKLR